MGLGPGRGVCALALAGVISFAALAHAEPAPDPAALLRQMYVASGEIHLARLGGVILSGDDDIGGLKGEFRREIDLRRGRDVLSFDVGVAKGRQETSPDGGWRTDEKGLTNPQNAPEALADAATGSYIDRSGWFSPDPAAPATFVGHRSEAGRDFDLVGVTPAGGRPLTLWIDSATHRLDRIVEVNAIQRQITTSFSDYRQVKGVWWAFVTRVSSGDPGSDEVTSIRRIELRSSLPDRDFAQPASVVRDARLVPGTPAAVPFELRFGEIVVEVSVNGRPPLPFMLDSGALNLITPEAAKTLGLGAAGKIDVNGVGESQGTAQLTRVRAYRVGPAELSDQTFFVVPLPPSATNSGRGPPLAGLIGYEFLRRFIVRVDYHRRLITVLPPADGAPAISGAKLHLWFEDRGAFVKAKVGSAEGYFGIDTGDFASITLFKAFYEAHAILIEAPAVRSLEGGLGGASFNLLTRVGSFILGPFTLSRPLAALDFASSGAFASTRLAGNLGSQVFQNFVMTFDYPDQALFLEKSPDFDAPVRYNGTGALLGLREDGAWVVAAVNPGSPAAAAGLAAGDLVKSVNGRSVDGESAFTVAEWFAAPAGATLSLDLVRAGKAVSVTITPADLLPRNGPLSLVAKPFG